MKTKRYYEIEHDGLQVSIPKHKLDDVCKILGIFPQKDHEHVGKLIAKLYSSELENMLKDIPVFIKRIHSWDRAIKLIKEQREQKRAKDRNVNSNKAEKENKESELAKSMLRANRLKRLNRKRKKKQKNKSILPIKPSDEDGEETKKLILDDDYDNFSDIF